MPDGTDVFEKPITNQWIRAELNLPRGELLRKEKVSGQTKYGNDNVIDSCDPNTFLNDLKYDFEFSRPGGRVVNREDVVTCTLRSKVRTPRPIFGWPDG